MKALHHYCAPCRWCCSGTPISTEIKDFIGQLLFLGVKLFCEKAYFNQFVSLILPALIWVTRGLLYLFQM